MNRFVTPILSLALAALTVGGSAAVGAPVENRFDLRPSDDVSSRVLRLERQNADLERRVDRLERLIGNGGHLPPPNGNYGLHVCRLKDTYNGRSYLGRAETEIEAQHAAREDCQKAVNPVYCQAQLECAEEGYNEATCELKDTYNGRSYLARGRSILEATHNAAKECEDTVNPVYCQSQPTCEEVR